MNFSQAIETAEAIAPGATYLVHLSHEVSHSKKQPELPEGCQLAYDGLRLTTPL